MSSPNYMVISKSKGIVKLKAIPHIISFLDPFKQTSVFSIGQLGDSTKQYPSTPNSYSELPSTA